MDNSDKWYIFMRFLKSTTYQHMIYDDFLNVTDNVYYNQQAHKKNFKKNKEDNI